MKSHLKEYKCWLEKELDMEIKRTKSRQNYSNVSGLVSTIHNINEMLEDDIYDKDYETVDECKPKEIVYEFTPEVAKQWVMSMYSTVNGKKTVGQKWTLEQTTSVAEQLKIKFEHITKYCWYATMNMMYHDYRCTAVEFENDEPAFYASLSKGFLFDEDAKSPRDKITEYYYHVVK